jgi:hypothetical protein
MTQDIIAMAREVESEVGFQWCVNFIELERFAALVAKEAERKASFDKADIWLKRINDAVAEEREACAKVCDEASDKALSLQSGRQDDLGSIILKHHAVAHQSDASAIRARSQA